MSKAIQIDIDDDDLMALIAYAIRMKRLSVNGAKNILNSFGVWRVADLQARDIVMCRGEIMRRIRETNIDTYTDGAIGPTV